MGIKLSKTRDELICNLKKRKLHLDTQEANDVLKKINYFQLINGFETLLLPNKLEKKYDSETLDDFLALYNFDKSFSEITFSKITQFETKLKTSISYHFTNNHCNSLVNTMQYTNPINYRDPRRIENYPFKDAQYKSIYENFLRFDLFKPYFLTNLVDRNDWINYNFYQDYSYEPPQGVAIYRSRELKPTDNNIAVPLWVAIHALDFGTVKRMCHYLTDDDFELVLSDFNFSLSQKHIFLSMVDIIHELRNKCAHLSLINRFRTPKIMKINTAIITGMDMSPKETGRYNSVISLYDSLKVLGYFEDISGLKKPLKKIIYRNNRMFKRKRYDLNERLLIRMGQPSYKKWKVMLSKNNYYLN